MKIKGSWVKNYICPHVMYLWVENGSTRETFKKLKIGFKVNSDYTD